MKKYKRKTPLYSPIKMIIASIGVAVAAMMIGFFTGMENEWFIICAGFSLSLFVVAFIGAIAVWHHYVYEEDFIKLSYFFIPYGKKEYKQFSAICISNASYNNGYGGVMCESIPMRYKKEGKKETYPFLTLHKPNYPIQQLAYGMSSRDIFMLNDEEVFCLGICWMDSLEDLLNHTQIPIYILEDIYLRFQDELDTIFMHRMRREKEVFIVTKSEKIGYLEYLRLSCD